jgi:hypothetical protein
VDLEGMMGFQRALELTEKYYGAYPGPRKETYELAEGVAGYFKKNAVRSPGVIAVAYAGNYYYLGLSPDLQRDVMTVMREGQSKSHGHFRLGRGLEAELGVKFDLSRKVSDDLVGKVKSNFGCAEKKIVSNLNQRGDKMEQISVIAYPDNIYSDDIPAHIVVASADGAYIAPCASCLAIYTG